MKKAPAGHKVLKEGQAQILYIEQKLEKDSEGFIKAQGRKKQANEINETRGAVFYNPVQEFNRDISITVIREYIKTLQEEKKAKNKDFEGVKILEALAATGLRSVRYMKEIDHVSKLVANDWDPKAVELINKNFEFNDVEKDKCETYAMDAVDLLHEMRAKKELFDVVDLDPYGSAIPFLEASFGAIRNGGLLAVTFTDMAVLCARKPHVCFYKYGAAPLPNKYCHEMALRIVLKMINEMANRHGKYIEPLISLTVDFYVRLFIRVKNGPAVCHQSLLKYSHVHQCIDCEAFYLQPMGREIHQTLVKDEKTGKIKKYKHAGKPQGKAQQKAEEKEELKKGNEEEEKNPNKETMKVGLGRVETPRCCNVCDGQLFIGGPIWNRPIHNVEFAQRVLKTVKEQKEVKLGTSPRIKALMTGIIDEQPLEHIPLSFNYNSVCSSIKGANPEKKHFVYAVNKLGYKAIQTYYSAEQWKSDAPIEVIYDIFKAWKHQCSEGDEKKLFANLNPNTPGNRILSKPLVNKNIKFATVSDDEGEGKEDDNIPMQKVLGKNKKQKKYYDNPEPNWGPKPRATGK